MVGIRRRSLLLLPLFACPGPARAEAALPALMARLGAVAERRAVFTEERHVAALTTPLSSRGRLFYRRPDYLEKVTEWPIAERMVVDGDRLVITPAGNDPPQVVPLGAAPELRTMVDGMRGPLSGDLVALQRGFTVTLDGDIDTREIGQWTLGLTPRDARALALLRRIEVSGQDDWIAAIRVEQANGDTSVMHIDKA